MPLTKAVGTKTAHNTSATAMIGALTSRIALNDASKGARPLSILRCTFSTTTIASSTTMPIASTNPKSDRFVERKSHRCHHREFADQRHRDCEQPDYVGPPCFTQ